MPSTIVLIAAGAAVIYAFLQLVLSLTQDTREPPAIERSLPFLSPLIRMVKHNTIYYNHIRKRGNRFPIYTLRLPTVRVYIIHATELIPAVQRQWRTVSFTPIMANAGRAVLGVSQTGTDILRKDLTSDSNPVVGLLPILSRVMAPGPSLDCMVRRAAEIMTTSMDRLKRGDGAPVTIKLYEWTRHEILMATTEAVFGPKNPYQEPAVESAWRTLEPSYLSLALSPLKPLTSPRALQAREFLASSFISYLENNGPATASAFIREAHAHNVSHGFTTDDLARFEIGHSHAVIGSTAPTAWWLLWHVYSDPVVLGEVRAELEELAADSLDPLGEKTRSLDLSLLTSHASILQSALKETLRVHTISPAVRFCLEDHLLEGKYLLRKGALVIVPQPLHHSSTFAWGEKGHNHVAFRAFGGGHTLCPGRHFSAAEIVAFVAMMVLRFDVAPKKAGKWVAPTCEKTPMVASLQIPDEDVEVEVRARENGRGQWQFVSPGAGKE